MPNDPWSRYFAAWAAHPVLGSSIGMQPRLMIAVQFGRADLGLAGVLGPNTPSRSSGAPRLHTVAHQLHTVVLLTWSIGLHWPPTMRELSR